MTREELAERLNHLDPGACLTVEVDSLADAFGSGSFNDDLIHRLEAFAEEHRCTFAYDRSGTQLPTFEKDDVF